MKSLREKAMDMLARREHSQAELITKLCAKGAERDEAERIVDQLIADGLQSDTRYTEAYIRSRVSAGMGPERIRAELKQRQIDDNLLTTYLPNDAEFWYTKLSEVWCRKFDQKPQGQQAYAKQLRFLQQRGFSVAMIHRLLHDDIEISYEK